MTVQPQAKLSVVQTPLRPSEARLGSHPGARDRLTTDKVPLTLHLTYKFTLAEAGKVTPRLPLLNKCAACLLSSMPGPRASQGSAACLAQSRRRCARRGASWKRPARSRHAFPCSTSAAPSPTRGLGLAVLQVPAPGCEPAPLTMDKAPIDKAPIMPHQTVQSILAGATDVTPLPLLNKCAPVNECQPLRLSPGGAHDICKFLGLSWHPLTVNCSGAAPEVQVCPGTGLQCHAAPAAAEQVSLLGRALSPCQGAVCFQGTDCAYTLPCAAQPCAREGADMHQINKPRCVR